MSSCKTLLLSARVFEHVESSLLTCNRSVCSRGDHELAIDIGAMTALPFPQACNVSISHPRIAWWHYQHRCDPFSFRTIAETSELSKVKGESGFSRFPQILASIVEQSKVSTTLIRVELHEYPTEGRCELQFRDESRCGHLILALNFIRTAASELVGHLERAIVDVEKQTEAEEKRRDVLRKFLEIGAPSMMLEMSCSLLWPVAPGCVAKTSTINRARLNWPRKARPEIRPQHGRFAFGRVVDVLQDGNRGPWRVELYGPRFLAGSVDQTTTGEQYELIIRMAPGKEEAWLESVAISASSFLDIDQVFDGREALAAIKAALSAQVLRLRSGTNNALKILELLICDIQFRVHLSHSADGAARVDRLAAKLTALFQRGQAAQLCTRQQLELVRRRRPALIQPIYTALAMDSSAAPVSFSRSSPSHDAWLWPRLLRPLMHKCLPRSACSCDFIAEDDGRRSDC